MPTTPLTPPKLPAAVHASLPAWLAEVERVFAAQLADNQEVVDRLCRHVERYRGKMLRPTLVLLSGLAAHGAWKDKNARSHDLNTLLSPAHTTLAAVCEMVHMATLVHDDVLDDAQLRRGGQSVNQLYGNQTAVLLGDYLIAGAYHLCATLGEASYARAIGRASMSLCAGELIQLGRRGDDAVGEETYLDIIARKTAALIAVCCELGAAASGADASAVRALAAYGRDVGLAFQIQDDLLDVAGEASVVGKPVLQDLSHGTLTLPVIHHLRAAGAGREASLGLLRRISAGEHAGAELREALERTGSIGHAVRTAAAYVESAIASLSVLPGSPAKDALTTLAHGVIRRDS